MTDDDDDDANDDDDRCELRDSEQQIAISNFMLKKNKIHEIENVISCSKFLLSMLANVSFSIAYWDNSLI